MYLGVSKNNDTPKSSILIGFFHDFHHPFWGTQELVRCTVATAGNDHRLGAQEAPPAIISCQGWMNHWDDMFQDLNEKLNPSKSKSS